MQVVQYGFLLWRAEWECEKTTMFTMKHHETEMPTFFMGGVSPGEGPSPSAFLLTPPVLIGEGDKDALGWRVLGGVERVGVETGTSGVLERLLLSLSSCLRRAASVLVDITASA